MCGGYCWDCSSSWWRRIRASGNSLYIFCGFFPTMFVYTFTQMSYSPRIKFLKPGRAERYITARWRGLRNLAMAEKLSTHEALSVLAEGEAIGGGLYKLRRFIEGRDYCDPYEEAWIWSIAKNRMTNEIWASTSASLYSDETTWECLFLR